MCRALIQLEVPLLTYIRKHYPWLIFISILLLARSALSVLVPLTDFSEARYAEIARKILEYDDWITLWFTPDQPFWGKPPLAFWSIAISFGLFGLNEFVARLPSLLFTLMTAALLFNWVRKHQHTDAAWATVTVFLGSWLVLHVAGAVITDPLLSLTMTLVMLTFWDTMRPGPNDPERQNRNRDGPSLLRVYLMWVALGAGLLVKGPIALVLCGLACGIWVLLYNQWFNLFKHIRFISGLVLMILVAGPWYYLAEQKTPGFIDYFLIGEHFSRFTEVAWEGDLYGGVKDQRLGTIWVYFLISLLPWSLIVIGRLFTRKARRAFSESYRHNPEFIGYLLLWALTPILFFTFAKNILVTYVLPALPACAILIGLHFDQWVMPRKRLFQLASATTVTFFAIYFSLYFYYFENHRYNQKPLVMKYHELSIKDPGPLVYFGAHRFSPVFYTRENVAFSARPMDHLREDTVYFAVRDMWKSSTRQSPMKERCTEKFLHDEFSLWHCPAVIND